MCLTKCRGDKSLITVRHLCYIQICRCLTELTIHELILSPMNINTHHVRRWYRDILIPTHLGDEPHLSSSPLIVANSVGSLTPSTSTAHARTERSGSTPAHSGHSANSHSTLVQTLFEGTLTNETRCLTCETVRSFRSAPQLRSFPKRY